MRTVGQMLVCDGLIMTGVMGISAALWKIVSANPPMWYAILMIVCGATSAAVYVHLLQSWRDS